MSTIRNVKEHIIAKLQSICFETKVTSDTILKIVEVEHDSPPIRCRLYIASSCQRVHYGKRGKNYCGETSETLLQTGDQDQQQ